ncbi:intraflagellar transport complex B protein 46 C terminal-domain-containing protein [Chytridium lagenaria]|nr:intraflagellar transport complex B protein 46 C terminal-domain-containing protein [Chytridium lagenaria]
MSGDKGPGGVKPNTYYDESLELTEDEDEEDDEEEEDDDGQLSGETSPQPPRGDTPPSGNLSDSEDEYDQGDDDDDEQSGMHPISAAPRTGANAVNPRSASNSQVEKQLTVPSKSVAQRTSRTNKLGDSDGLDTSGRAKLGKPLGVDDDLDGRSDDETSGLSSMRFAAGKPTFNANLKDFAISDEMKELFQYISRYKPQEIDMEPVLKPFIPDYIPAIGDIDAFIKIPRPDGKPDSLGLSVLDEPAGKQSDPTVLDLHLRAVSKSSAPVPQVVRSLDSVSLRSNSKPLENWIRNVKELHTAKPPPSVHYSRRMPDIEDLMQVWSPEVEQALQTINLPSPELDMPIGNYSRLIASILDIPAPNPATSQKANAGKDGKKRPPTSTVEALHVIFTLYSEFKNSQHFGAALVSPTGAPERFMGPSQ